MPKERVIREQLAEFATIADQLVDVAGTAKKAFIRQSGQLLVQVNNRQDPLIRSITSAIGALNESAAGVSEGEREPYLRLISILTHLLIITETTCRLEETLQKQIKEGVLFSDKAISQVGYLFDKQTGILSNIADIMRNDEKEIHRQTLDECKNLGQSCLQFATDHEMRLVEGLCFPLSAPLFLAIIDQMQTIIHHERKVVTLLGTGL